MMTSFLSVGLDEVDVVIRQFGLGLRATRASNDVTFGSGVRHPPATVAGASAALSSARELIPSSFVGSRARA
jgi:hypothetical protein